MKAIRRFLLGGLVLAVSLLFIYAQESPADSTNELSDTEVMLQAIMEAAPPVPAASVPEPTSPFHGFFSAQHSEDWPPLPGNMFNFDVWLLGEGYYLLDDRDFDYDAVSKLLRPADSGPTVAARGTMMNMSIAYSGGEAMRPYLTNLVGVLEEDQTMTTSFDVAGGTNFMPWDILTSTSITNPVSGWTWLGTGYTSNRYTFTNQPGDISFYKLARPINTMTVAWGNNQSGEGEVPWGLSNVVQVAGGFSFSLGLLSDGSVVAWGLNNYGQTTVPTNVVGASMVAAGLYHSVALLTNGSVVVWGLHDPPFGEHIQDIPADLTNATVISALGNFTLALRSNGTVAAWGQGDLGETNVPAGLTNVIAIAAGFQHSLAVSGDGTVSAWGRDNYSQCSVPADATNVWDVAAGVYHSTALRRDGTVVCWGDNSHGECNVPDGLSNVVAIAAGGNPSYDSRYSAALKSDGTVEVWGAGAALWPVVGLSNVIAIAGGAHHALGIRTGPKSPVLVYQPQDQYQAAGGNATFQPRVAAVYDLDYQWQYGGVDIPDETNATLTLTSVHATNEGVYRFTVSNDAGSIVSSNASFYLVTAPVISQKTPATNPVVYDQSIPTLSVLASAPGETNGFPLSYQWQFNGTNVAGATNSGFTFLATNGTTGQYSVTVANAAGSTNTAWDVTWDGNTLANFLFTNTAAHTNGKVGYIWSGFAWGQTNATNCAWLTNGFLTGLRGATAISAANEVGQFGTIGTYATGTALTRRHVYVLGHDNGGTPGEIVSVAVKNGKKYWFIGTNNVAVSGTIADNRVCLANGEDWSIFFLSSDLPDEVETMRCVMDGDRLDLARFVTPGNFWNKMPAPPPWPVWPVFGTCQHNQIGGNISQYAIFDNHPINVGGDSGSPDMILLTNEVVFLSGRSCSGVTSLMLSNMNAMTLSAGLSTNHYRYQPQFVDLSAWPNLR
jgi:hypothetical protein